LVEELFDRLAKLENSPRGPRLMSDEPEGLTILGRCPSSHRWGWSATASRAGNGFRCPEGSQNQRESAAACNRFKPLRRSRQ
jgi:hypothetical protein